MLITYAIRVVTIQDCDSAIAHLLPFYARRFCTSELLHLRLQLLM